MSETTHTLEAALAPTLEEHEREPIRISLNRVFTIALIAVFFLVMMVCLTAGVTIYRNVTVLQSNADTLHMESGLLVNLVRMNDDIDTVSMAAGPEGNALVLTERLESGTYETRIYRYEGAIVHEYAIAGRPIKPENAIVIVETGTFEFSYENGLVTFITDDGSFSAALRSDQSSGSFASSGYSAAVAAEHTEGWS